MQRFAQKAKVIRGAHNYFPLKFIPISRRRNDLVLDNLIYFILVTQPKSRIIITDHVRSTRKGNVFTDVCDSVRGGGRVHPAQVLSGEGEGVGSGPV